MNTALNASLTSAIDPSLQLIALPARTDNYIWLLHNGTHAWVVDPTDAEPVQAYLAQHHLILADILITHHHNDHTAGITQLSALCTGRIYGDSDRIAGLTARVHAPHTFYLSHTNIEVQLMATPGHTHDHVVYYCPHLLHTGVLFCGDAWFSAGCGRVFDGTVADLGRSIARLMQLPAATQLACAHEYTTHNLRFARAIDATHEATHAHENRVKYCLLLGAASLPSTVATELRINPFCRALAYHPEDAYWRDAVRLFAHNQGLLDDALWAAIEQAEANHYAHLPHEPHPRALAWFALLRHLRNHF